MSEQTEFCLDKATEAEIAEHLLRCDADFVPPLSGRVEINSYAHKITDKATRFEAWADGILVGLMAAYCNDSERCTAYITSISVLHEWQGKGIAAQLMERCIKYLKELCFERIELEVDSGNVGAVRLYKKMNFRINGTNGRTAIMRLDIEKET